MTDAITADRETRIRSDLAPTACLPFESENARSLHWLPLAVRHKLDAAGLRLKLGQWQALSLDVRAALLRRLPEEGFSACALAAGADAEPRAEREEGIDEAELASWLGISPQDARNWLVHASPFARYVAGKRIRAGRRACSS